MARPKKNLDSAEQQVAAPKKPINRGGALDANSKRLKTSHKPLAQRLERAIKLAKNGYSLYDIEQRVSVPIAQLQAHQPLREAISERNHALLTAQNDAVVCAAPATTQILADQIAALSKTCASLEKQRSAYPALSSEFKEISKLLAVERNQIGIYLKLSNNIADKAILVAPQTRDMGDSSSSLDDFIKVALEQQGSASPSQLADDAENAADSSDLDAAPSSTYPESTV